ncbi:regulator of chromosome condensation 1/beta-lactamase-inhibitor protein II, partial [Dimargaris cristalligena]
INAAPVRRSDCGNVLVFGNGDCGQLGLGEDIMQRKKPYPLAALNSEQVVDIAAGGLHNMALTADGRLFSWGCNDQRALGREGDEMTPAEVKLPLPVPTGSALHPLNEEQKASVAANAEPMRIIKVACGDSATVALTNYGVYSWGTYRSAEGLLGFNPEREIQATPVRIEGIDDEIVDLSVGADHVLALTRQGDVYGWGDGQQHQLGRRIIERRKRNGLRPTKLGLKHVVLIGTGAYHSFAVTETGDLYAWGLNNFHQCGVDPEDGGDEAIITMPTLVRSLQGIPLAQVTGGEHHSLVLAADGSVYGFGRSDSHQVGLPYTTLPEEVSGEPFDESEFQTHKKSINRPTKLSDCPLFRQLICGSNHNLALTKEGGDVYSWGYGDMLALGNGEEEDVSTPTLIEGKRLEDARVINIAAGGQHSVL